MSAAPTTCLIEQGYFQMHLTPLSQNQFEQLARNAKVLEADGFGPKVLHLESGLFLKLFRRKRWLSTALWRPYSVRFAKNAERLQHLGIPTLEVRALYLMEDKSMTAVLYSPLPGLSVTQLASQPGFRWEAIFTPLVEFIRDLHQKGVYFRSLHLGNIIQTPEGKFGLIDISDMRFMGKPLSSRLVRRNLTHFHRYLKRERLEQEFPYPGLYEALTGTPASSVH